MKKTLMLVVGAIFCDLLGGCASQKTTQLGVARDVLLPETKSHCPDWIRSGRLYSKYKEGFYYPVGIGEQEKQGPAMQEARTAASRDVAATIFTYIEDMAFIAEGVRDSSFYVPIQAQVKDILASQISRVAMSGLEDLDSCVEHRQRLTAGVVEDYLKVYRLFEISKAKVPDAIDSAKAELQKAQKAYETAREQQKANLIEVNIKALEQYKQSRLNQ